MSDGEHLENCIVQTKKRNVIWDDRRSTKVLQRNFFSKRAVMKMTAGIELKSLILAQDERWRRA